MTGGRRTHLPDGRHLRSREGAGGRRLRGRYAPTSLLATVRRITDLLERTVERDVAAWTVLVGLTAGEGLGLNRAFLLLAENDALRGWCAIGPRTREEAWVLWAELRQHGVRPLDLLENPDPEAIAAERARHQAILEQVSSPLDPACAGWSRAFLARSGHPVPCVRHWLQVLGSRTLAVVPVGGGEGLWGVILADNFVNHAPISQAMLDSASFLAHELRAAVERATLLERLREEERRRMAAEHTTALLEAARTLAHDLKNPLALAGGLATELAVSMPEEHDALVGQLGVVASAVRDAESRLAQLIQGLAARANGVSLSPVEVVGLVEHLAGAFRHLATSRQIRIACNRPSCDVLAAAEPSYLERCIENLLGNALEALRDAHRVGGEVQVTVLSESDHVRIEVADNGPPLPAPLRADPFAGGITTRRSGTGVGLVSVRRLMDAMGGTVEYDEVESGWVRFTLKLRRWG